MKRELILQGMGWGHMPLYLVQEDLDDGRLLDISGQHLKGSRVDVVAARRQGEAYGPIANRLWDYIEQQAQAFTASAGALP
jgi:DNA-binding transcriptional LysR family regulator